MIMRRSCSVRHDPLHCKRDLTFERWNPNDRIPMLLRVYSGLWTSPNQQMEPRISPAFSVTTVLLVVMLWMSPGDAWAQQTDFLPGSPRQVGHYTDYDTLTVGETWKWREASYFQNQSSDLNGSLGFAEAMWVYTNFLEADAERDSLSTGIALGDAETFGADDRLTFVTGGRARAVVGNSGLGVGTTFPDAALHVTSADFNGETAEYPTPTGLGDVGIYLQSANNALEISNSAGWNDRKAWILARHSDAGYRTHYSSLHLQPDIGSNSHWKGVGIGFPADVDLPFSHLAVNGKVGIGTTNPGGYQLAVEGDVGARKVIVTDASFADYVFEEDYQLRSLKDVEVFIDRHGHLPGMPSGVTVAQEGQDLGSIQVTLTEKVEELTLYAIEQHHRSDSLARQVRDLNSTLDAVRDRRDTQQAQIETLTESVAALQHLLNERSYRSTQGE